jgi:cytochrome c biogenesis protein CcmG/thiol:disulfide interchange protein DsbE
LPSTPSSTDAAARRSPRTPSRRAIVTLVAISCLVPLAILVVILTTNRHDDPGTAVAAGCPTSTTAPPRALAPAAPSGVPARAEVGAPAPDFELLTLDRCTTERLSAHRGTPVVLTFFASWCHPCEEEMPLLEAAHQDNPSGFDVLAVTYKDLRPDAVQFTDRLGVTYPALFDTDGKVGDRYGVSGIPQTWFIDADGVVRDRVFGITSKRALDEPLHTLLAPDE